MKRRRSWQKKRKWWSKRRVWWKRDELDEGGEEHIKNFLNADRHLVN